MIRELAMGFSISKGSELIQTISDSKTDKTLKQIEDENFVRDYVQKLSRKGAM